MPAISHAWALGLAVLLSATLGCGEGKSLPSPLNSASQPAPEPTIPGSEGVPLRIESYDAGHWRVEHLSGASIVPKQPARVCSLAFTDELLAIGAKPAGASSSATGFPDYLRPQLEGVTPIYQMMGTMFPDFEAIVHLQPDLILTANADPQTYAQLSKIAPVVVLERTSWNDRQRILDVGRLLGKELESKAVLAAHEAKVAAAREVLQKKIGDAPVSFFRVFGRQMYIHGQTRGGLILYDQLGLKPPAILDDSPRGYMLSPEALLSLDAQHLFVAAENNLGARRSWENLLGHPAWKRVPAVQAGNVYLIAAQHQWLVPGIQGRSRMIDEIVTALAPEAKEAIQRAAQEAGEAAGP